MHLLHCTFVFQRERAVEELSDQRRFANFGGAHHDDFMTGATHLIDFLDAFEIFVRLRPANHSIKGTCSISIWAFALLNLIQNTKLFAGGMKVLIKPTVVVTEKRVFSKKKK